MPVVISGGGAVATVADTPQIDLGLTNAQLTADVVAGSIDSTQLSSAVNSALTLAGTAVQPAALTSYLPLSGGALTGAVTSTSTITTRQSANTVQFLVSSGTAQTINWNNGGSINLDLSSASGNVTLTLQNPASGATYRMRVQQGATVRNLTFPDGTVQQGGGSNVYTGIAGVDFLTVYYNGSAYLVQSVLNSGFTLSAASIAAAYLALAGGTMTGNLNLPSLNGGQLAGMRNKIINGGCLVSQRGAVSVFNNTVTYGGADRIYGFVSGTTASATLQTLSVPVDNLSSTGVYQVLGPMTSTGTTTALLGQRIEAKNTGDLNSKTITVKANVYQDTGTTQTFAIRVMKGNAIDTFTAPVLIATSSGVSVPHATATPVTFTLTLGSSDANNGLQVDIISTTLPALTSKYIGIGDFQLEPGSVATPFERRSYGQELALCQRYYYEDPGLVGTGIGTTAIARATANHPVRMRTAPNVTVSNAVEFFNGTSHVTATGGVANYSNTSYVNIDIFVGGSGVTGSACCRAAATGKITVEAEI